MEADGIITRTVYPEVPPRVEYALSELGETMRPILDSMKTWGENYKKGYLNSYRFLCDTEDVMMSENYSCIRRHRDT